MIPFIYRNIGFIDETGIVVVNVPLYYVKLVQVMDRYTPRAD